MDIQEREEFTKKLDRLTDEDKYEEILAMYNAIPKEEWDLKMKVDYSQVLMEKATMECEKGDEDRISIMEQAISCLEDCKEEGESDYYWNYQMGLAYYMMGHFIADFSRKNGLEVNYVMWYNPAYPYLHKAKLLDKEHNLVDVNQYLFRCMNDILLFHVERKEYKLAFEVLDGVKEANDKYDEMGLFTLTDDYPHSFSVEDEYEGLDLSDQLEEDMEKVKKETSKLVNEGRDEEAVELFYDWILKVPSPRNSYINVTQIECLLGCLFLLQKKYLNAAIVLYRAFTNASHAGYNEPVLIHLAYAFYKLGDWEKTNYFLETLKENWGEINMDILCVKDKEFKNFVEASVFMDKLEKDSD